MCADIVGASVYLGFQVFDFLESVGRYGMAFRKSGDTDAHLREVLLDEGHKLGSVSEPAFDGCEVCLTLWRVPAQGHDVFDVVIREELENLMNLALCVADACEVRNNVQVRLGLQFHNQIPGEISGGTACAVGNAHIAGPQR